MTGVLPLHAAGTACVSVVGNKAKNLGRLLQKGYPVCSGYVLQASFFEQFCMSAGANFETISTQEIALARFTDGQLQSLATIFNALQKNRKQQLIVRSSTVEEDGDGRSFAGIYESVPEIMTFSDFIGAVRQVWSSYYTPSAIAYRADAGVRSQPMAVIVQQMIHCDCSGVLFTRDPLAGRSDSVIEATLGNNDGITGGSGECVHYSIPMQGSDSFIANPQRGGSNPLKGTEPNKLVRMGRKLEEDFGFPADIEWGIVGGRIWIFQLRPMRVKRPEHPFSEPESDGYDCILLDRYAQPASICYLSLLASWQNCVYLSLYSTEKGRVFPHKPLAFLHNRVYWNVKYQKEYFEAKPATAAQRRLKEKTITCGYRLWYARLPWYLLRIRRLRHRLDAAMDSKSCALVLQKAIQNFCVYIGVDHFRFLGVAQLLYKQLPILFPDESLLKQAEQYVGLYSSRNRTVAVNVELQHLAGIIRKDRALLRLIQTGSPEDVWRELKNNPQYETFDTELHRFLKRHGHRGIACDDLLYPHWGEDPDKVILLLRQLSGNEQLFPEVQEQNIKRIEKALLALYAQQQKTKAGRVKIRKALHQTGEYMRLRENQRYFFDKSWVLLRMALLRLGDFFVHCGWLAQVDDIFYCTIDEITDAVAFTRRPASPAYIAGRRARLHCEGQRVPPYVVKGADEILIQKKAGSRSYKGMGISSGVAVGKVRFIRDIADIGKVRSGEVGIVDTFHPSWTPILKVVKGLIMNYGNILSHGAVVAREYGIPVVVFSGDTSAVLQQGDTVEINGSTGRIRILEYAEDDA